MPQENIVDTALFDINNLTTHGLILGKTGSGKTGGILTLIEDSIKNNTNIIVVDPKGDISNICNTNIDSHKYRIFTPGDGRLGLSYNIDSLLYSLTNKIDDNAAYYLNRLFALEIPQDSWPKYLIEPPFELNKIGDLELGQFFPFKDRLKLARKLTTFNLSEKWGKSSIFLFNGVTVYNLSLLNETERQAFVSSVLDLLIKSTRSLPQSNKLHTLLVLDEASSYIPPQPYNPLTKSRLHTLISQGRAYGLGILLGAQNPNDLDYKIISNVQHWFVGSLRERDLKRDLLSELENRGILKENILNLNKREFYYLGHDHFKFTFRDFNCAFNGPLNKEQCDQLNYKNHYSTDIIFDNLYNSPFEITAKINETFTPIHIGHIEKNNKTIATWLVSFDIELPADDRDIQIKIKLDDKIKLIRKQLILNI